MSMSLTYLESKTLNQNKKVWLKPRAMQEQNTGRCIRLHLLALYQNVCSTFSNFFLFEDRFSFGQETEQLYKKFKHIKKKKKIQ